MCNHVTYTTYITYYLYSLPWKIDDREKGKIGMGFGGKQDYK